MASLERKLVLLQSQTNVAQAKSIACRVWFAVQVSVNSLQVSGSSQEGAGRVGAARPWSASAGSVDKSPHIDWMRERLLSWIQTDPVKA